MGLPSIIILSVGLGAVLANAIPQDGVGNLNAFVSAASLGSDPLVTSASETRFRFGGTTSGQGKSTSDRRLFIPGLDRRERKPTGLGNGASALLGAPPKTTKIPTTTPSPKPKSVIKSNDNKFSDDYYYADDEYYYDYYEYYYDDKNANEERKIGALGALDPPSAPPTRPTPRTTQASTTSRPFRFDFNNKLKERPSLISSRTTPLPTRTSSKAQSARSSLAALLLKRIKAESQANTPVNNDLTGQDREPRVIEETHTEKEEMQVHVTTNTESSRVVSSIKASHSITSEDPTLTTPTQSFVDETTTTTTTTTTTPTPSSTTEVTDLSTTTLPETTSKRSLADISETVDIESFLTGNVNSKEPSFKSLDDTQININVDVLATEKNSEAIQSTTTTTTAAAPKIETTTTSTVAEPKIESTLDVSSIFETLLRKQAEAKTEIYPSLTETSKLGSLLSSLKNAETTTKPPTTTTTSTPFDAQAFFHSILRNKPYKKPEPETTTTTVAPTTTTINNTEKSDENIFDLFPAIQPANVSSFLPPGYKPVEEQNEDSSKVDIEPVIKTVDVSAFLPPGYKPPADAKNPVVETLDVSDFLPPNYKPQGSDDETSKNKVEIEFVDMSSFFENNDSIQEKPEGEPVIKQVDVSAFLPPGYKAKEDGSEPAAPAIKTVDVSSFLPPGYKPPKDENSSPASPAIKSVDVSAFLPPGYKPSEVSDDILKITATEATTTTTKKGPKGLKFPKRVDRPAFLRPTTTTPSGPTASGPPPVKPTIRNIFANRPVTKAFTGWGFTTQPTVPKPVIKSIDPSSFLPTGFKSVDVSSFLPPGYKPPEGEDQGEDEPFRSTPSTKPPTTSTTTTTTTTQRPTTPGTCGEKCRLFATIRITNGTRWYPELANRDTIEWQQLANSIEIELDQLYRSGPLAPWYMGVEIDGFHKGSVVVDYFLQLSEIVENNIATNDLKEVLNMQTASGEGHTLGNFTLDSSSTDFVVMKEKEAIVQKDDNGYLIPQWLIAVIVIGLASLLFILIFGITVLVNRSRVNKRHSVPLTEEMLNELNKSHHMGGGFTHDKSHMGGGFTHGGHPNMGHPNMGHPNMGHHHGGVDNYAMDAGLYDMDAVWNDKRMDKRMMKPPSSQGKGYNPNYNINIYDSWRTDWSGPYGSSATYAKRPRTDTNF